MPELNENQFGEHLSQQIEAHKAEQPYSTPKRAYGQCGGSALRFVRQFPQFRRLSFAHPQGSWAEGQGGPNAAHAASVYAPEGRKEDVNDYEGHHLVVDWTARQFDPKAGHPHIEPLESYKKRWGNVQNVHTKI
jgi:hypothetical protein